MVTGYSNYRCPKCGHQFTWIQRCRLAPWGVRKIIPCPSCKEPLEWSKWPHRVLYLWLLYVLVGSFGNHSQFWFILASIALLATLVAFCFLKIESHASANSIKTPPRASS